MPLLEDKIRSQISRLEAQKAATKDSSKKQRFDHKIRLKEKTLAEIEIAKQFQEGTLVVRKNNSDYFFYDKAVREKCRGFIYAIDLEKYPTVIVSWQMPSTRSGHEVPCEQDRRFSSILMPELASNLVKCQLPNTNR